MLLQAGAKPEICYGGQKKGSGDGRPQRVQGQTERLYYENATHQLRNVMKAQKGTLRKRKKKCMETHDTTVRKRIIPVSICLT